MNMEIAEYKKLYETIKSAFDTGNMVFSDVDLCIDLTFATENDAVQVQNQLTSFSIERNNTQIRVDCKTNSLHIYKDIDDYRLKIKLDDFNDFKTNILILNFSGNSFFYDKTKDSCLINFIDDNNCYLFSNTHYFFHLISFLKQHEHKEDHQFYFVDYFNKDNRRIIITSSAKQGKLTVGYEQKIPDFPLDKSIGRDIDRFIDAFNQKQMPKFIKTELFNVLPSCLEQNKRLEFFINHLPLILERAEQNFEIYLNDLTLDNFKKQYLDFRIKYFNLFRDILSKLTTQVLAFPLSISAAAFATYKVNNDEYLSYSIVAAFVIFGMYSLFMIGAYKQDIVENNNLFKREYDELNRNPFFVKYPNELEYFKSTKNFIDKRYGFLNKSLFIYSIVLSLVNSLFVFFILKQFQCLRHSITASCLSFGFFAIITIKQLCLYRKTNSKDKTGNI